MTDEEAGTLKDDALSALTNLGYQSKAAKRALEKVYRSGDAMTLEALIKKALKELA